MSFCRQRLTIPWAKSALSDGHWDAVLLGALAGEYASFVVGMNCIDVESFYGVRLNALEIPIYFDHHESRIAGNECIRPGSLRWLRFALDSQQTLLQIGEVGLF